MLGQQGGSVQHTRCVYSVLHEQTYSALISTRMLIPHLGEIRLQMPHQVQCSSLATCRNQQSTNSSHVPGHILEPGRNWRDSVTIQRLEEAQVNGVRIQGTQ